MKKFLYLTAVFMLAMSLCACGSSAKTDTVGTPTAMPVVSPTPSAVIDDGIVDDDDGIIDDGLTPDGVDPDDTIGGIASPNITASPKPTDKAK